MSVSTAPTPPPPQRGKGTIRGLVELVVTVAVAVGAALLIQAFLVKPYKIPSGSMIPTLSIGQRILVNRLDTKPAIGNIVVFHPPAGAVDTGDGICGNRNQGGDHRQACDKDYGPVSSQTFVKRVVGEAGDHLKILDGKVYRNGVEERGSYIQSCTSGAANCDFPTQITVPHGDYYMMGDNRGDSLDSRFWGPVPQSSIIGVAVATYWPLNRIGFF
jgi:signal peptidase I